MRSPVTDKIRIPNALWEGLKHVGIVRADMVRRAQIPISVVRDGAPVSTMQFFAIWRTLADISTNSAIALRIATGLEGTIMPPSFLAASHARDFHQERSTGCKVEKYSGDCLNGDVLLN